MFGLDVNLPEGATFEWLVAKPGAIALIIIVGTIARWLANRAIDRIVRRASSGTVPHPFGATRAGAALADLRPATGARRQQRAETMGSLLKSISTGLILAVVVVMVLDQVGVNIAPIIASAGIVGVALGFGAQNLVRDFLSGIFMILEDQYGVGDWVDLGEATGTVEAVGLRVTRLRDTDGTVWYVRNGEILRVGNQSQNWARSVLDVTVSYDSDLELVERLLAEESHAMYEQEEYRGVILEDPEVWGANAFAKDGVVMRVVLKTAPLQQWATTRALRARVKARFDREGIRIPTSFVTNVGGE